MAPSGTWDKNPGQLKWSPVVAAAGPMLLATWQFLPLGRLKPPPPVLFIPKSGSSIPITRPINSLLHRLIIHCGLQSRSPTGCEDVLGVGLRVPPCVLNQGRAPPILPLVRSDHPETNITAIYVFSLKHNEGK